MSNPRAAQSLSLEDPDSSVPYTIKRETPRQKASGRSLQEKRSVNKHAPQAYTEPPSKHIAARRPTFQRCNAHSGHRDPVGFRYPSRTFCSETGDWHQNMDVDMTNTTTPRDGNVAEKRRRPQAMATPTP